MGADKDRALRDACYLVWGLGIAFSVWGAFWGGDANAQPKKPDAPQAIITPVPVFDVVLYVPKSFELGPAQVRDTNLFIAAPFDTKKNLLVHKRYVNFDEPFASIVSLIYLRKFNADEAVTFVKEDLGKKQIELVMSEPKVFGSAGVVLEVRQFAQGVWFRKWISVFGNDSQTVVVVAAFPDARSEQLSDRLRRVVELAKMDTKTL